MLTHEDRAQDERVEDEARAARSGRAAGRSRRRGRGAGSGAAAKASARIGAPAYSWPSPGKIRERNAAANGDRARGRAPSGSCIAGRIHSTRRNEHRAAAVAPAPARTARPSHPDPEAECSDPSARSPTSSRRSTRSWTSGATGGRSPGCARRTPAARVELPRRPDHGQQPDGRPPRLGPRLQGPLPALPRDARRGPALPERVRLPGPVGRGQRRARPRASPRSATSRRSGSPSS